MALKILHISIIRFSPEKFSRFSLELKKKSLDMDKYLAVFIIEETAISKIGLSFFPVD